ncbi:NAD-dependent epimerase/dehydratase family protein [Desulfobacca acetoxidans]|uniref:UDP-glucose 4-epimerase n=1 Tax=Desulfobacca acetoxidans (strain ATCC 700848 / DSM 11109 / ASRB2) TaxID=880072 RepID=F2NIF7_DESAR|nr:NAD-dependent epimerase/dehydratase family protein [Desulfobacca acetoxidans]AEB10359.1 UDP-glucose 4-epimerase [Desulfobacca acetoxidans DSM 11109]
MVRRRILVTGGAGFIGSHVAESFLAAGHEVAIVDNLSTGRQDNVPVGAQFYPFDIKSWETFDFIRHWQPQVLVHHAAQMSVRISVDDPVRDAQENILGSLNLFEAAVQGKVEKIIFASTGGAMYGDQAPVPAGEEDRATPECPYGIAKLAVEHYMHFYHREHGVIPIRLRYANVYGPRQNGLGEAGVVAIFIEKFLAQEQPVINGDGLQTRDFVYVGDIVAANLLALEYSQAGTFNIGTGGETDILTIYLKLQEILGSKKGPVHGPTKPGEQRRSALDSTLAHKELGWRPRINLVEGLTRTVEAFQQRYLLK